MRIALSLIVALTAHSSHATVATPATSDLVCSYAPSQSKVVASISKVAAGGVGGTAAAMALATGLSISAVPHSSSALILTGSSGYIAGTLGLPAATFAAAPVIITVGLFVGGAAVTLELVCANKNHPAQAKAVEQAANEFSRRLQLAMERATTTSTQATKSVVPAVGRAAIEMKKVAGSALEYASRASIKARALFAS